MSVRFALTRLLAGAAALLSLAACAAQGPDGAQIRASTTRAALDRAGAPVLLAEIPALRLAATMAQAGSRDGVETWRTADDRALSFRAGVLIATRGLGHDLMSADVSGTIAALNGGPRAGYSRLLTYLDGEGGTLFRAMLCEMAAPVAADVAGIGITFPTRLSVETCRATGVTVTNRYWHDPDGTLRRAEEWIGPGPGMLHVERLTR